VVGETLRAQKVKVTVGQILQLDVDGKAKPAAKQTNGYESLMQAKKPVDAMSGVDKARATLDLLAKLL